MKRLSGRKKCEDHRPRSFYEILSDAPDHKVKRITVYPGKRLSCQRHFRKSEHWYIISGKAVVTKNSRDIELISGQAIDLPVLTWYCIQNRGSKIWYSLKSRLVIILKKMISKAWRMIMAGINEPIIKRYEKNPILTKYDVPYPVETVHNAGVVKHNSKYIMLFRSYCRNGRSIIGLAESDDGLNFRVRPEPFITPANVEPFASYEEYGLEDPRICVMGGEYLITYSAYSKHGVRVALAKTKDFARIERVSLITQADYRNVVLFPEKVNNRYVRLDRPHSKISPWSIWISYSPDLIHWGDSKIVIKPMVYHWDEMKVGPGATPVKTGKGWLNIYHGVFYSI